LQTSNNHIGLSTISIEEIEKPKLNKLGNIAEQMRINKTNKHDHDPAKNKEDAKKQKMENICQQNQMDSPGKANSNFNLNLSSEYPYSK